MREPSAWPFPTLSYILFYAPPEQPSSYSLQTQAWRSRRTVPFSRSRPYRGEYTRKRSVPRQPLPPGAAHSSRDRKGREKQELWSDSLDYYRESGHALLFRNIQIDDAEHKVLAFGDYGEYWKEPGNALLTQRPSVVSYDTSQSDSLYMCADSMFLYTISKSEQARDKACG